MSDGRPKAIPFGKSAPSSASRLTLFVVARGRRMVAARVFGVCVLAVPAVRVEPRPAALVRSPVAPLAALAKVVRWERAFVEAPATPWARLRCAPSRLLM